jgi:hypothetical protein
MRVSIGDITAECPHCGATEFEPQSAGALHLATEMKCAGCGAKTRYLALLDRIGEEAMRRANRAIDELRRGPKK